MAQQEPGKVRIRDLVSSLTVAQVWAVGAAIIGVIAGSVVVGYNVGSVVQNAKVEGLNSKISTFEADISTLNTQLSGKDRDLGLHMAKERFLSEYVRYTVAKYLPAVSNEPEETAKDNFVDLLAQWAKREGAGIPESELPDLEKGFDRQNGVMQFRDGTRWIIPPEIKDALHSR